MSENKNIDNPPEKGHDISDTNIAVSSSDVSSVIGSVRTTKTSQRVSSSSERQIKFERAQKCLENAALVSKRIKEHRKATAELLGRPFEEDDGGDTASEMASTMSERTGYSVATDTSTTLSVQDALNIPGISESLANTLKQKELLMERIKQYKEISKRPIAKSGTLSRRESTTDSKLDIKKSADNNEHLVSALKDKENALSVMQVKIRAMETTILDLQEKINEKDQIIEAKNKATTLMSDSLSKKEKDSLALLEDTRQQMTKMQENFVSMEAEWRQEKQRLLMDIEAKDEKIKNLEEANTILENSRFEISVEHSKIIEELETKNEKIKILEERIVSLSQLTEQLKESEGFEMEKSSQEVNAMMELSKKVELLEQLNAQISEESNAKTQQIESLEEKIADLSQTLELSSIRKNEDFEEEKGSREISDMVELTKKIELLEQLNCQIRQTNKELENKLAAVNKDSKPATSSSPTKKGSPLPIRKGGRNTASKMKSPWSQISSESLHQETDKKIIKNELTKLEMVVQSLNKEILEKEYVISQKESLITQLQSHIEETVSTKPSISMVDIGTCTDSIPNAPEIKDTKLDIRTDIETTDKPESLSVLELEEKLKDAQEQIALLNGEIDLANKNMIKVKSNHKIKLKQLQKTIENYSKVSDANAEIIKLNEELHQLSQKVAELEEEKGNLQLHLVDYDSGRLTESDVYKKLVEMENLAETRLKSISVLETQKFDLVQELHVLQQKNTEMEDKLADISQLQSEQVSSEIKSVQLEEQIDKLTASKNELELFIDNLKLDKEQLNGNIKVLQEEKEELIQKLDNYIQENIELTDKLEKLSAEKVSSAESIEIVESLTTQEKLELEEYNKAIIEGKIDNSHTEATVSSSDSDKNIENLIDESAELNKKIELFSQEREEVMEKMSKISAENDSLHAQINELNNQCSVLQNNIEVFNNEKSELQNLNQELIRQIDELKRERLEIMKEAVDVAKPVQEDTVDAATVEAHDDKTADKSMSRTKPVKQMTKEILKLKNIIKEREAEIADSQMKILSLEEQQQKQIELLQANTSNENKMKALIEENQQLLEEVNNLKKDQDTQQQMQQYQEQYKHSQELLQQEIQNIHQEYAVTVSARDARINELESLLHEYEKQIHNYGATIEQKDKDLTEYINQITKLNDVSQKLKSTIEVLEEEKAKDQSAELVKSLNKQVTVFQKKLTDFEEKIRILEEEKLQLISIKTALENKNTSIDTEINRLQDTLTEKQALIKELQTQQQKHSEEISAVKLETKERDEEVHEVKLQLRKESIENEKLRNSLTDKDNLINDLSKELNEVKVKTDNSFREKESLTEQFEAMETKNKELLEKLKKFAINIKKKSAMYTELEAHMNETQKQLEAKNIQLEQLLIQVETLPALQEKLKHAEEEINRLQSLKVALDQQKSENINQLEDKIESLGKVQSDLREQITSLNDSINTLQNKLNSVNKENTELKMQNQVLNNKIVDNEIEQRNNMNLLTKISTLEADINQKQNNINELMNKIEQLDQQGIQIKFGFDAKIQERDLFIENLESEINKYKSRICRLEDSISVMENSRHSLERKADQLDSQLQEKQKAYSEYTSQEDELVTRLAALMDHDRVVEKQLFEVENENKELQYKLQQITEDNQRLRKSLFDIQEHCNTMTEKASKADIADSEVSKYQSQLHDAESQLKRISHEHQTLLVQKKQEIDELESEFNTQIENAFKEKKALSERYEKVLEHVSQIEQKLQEYKHNNENLNHNLHELNRINQELMEKSSRNEEIVQAPDYTEQYISEINSLNAVINNKNQEIMDLNGKINYLQTNNVALISNFESKISELTTTLKNCTLELEQSNKDLDALKQDNQNLQIILSQKEEQIKELKEKSKLTFEMNIPKTEGMIISSTIEALNEEPKQLDMAGLESQIISDMDIEKVEKKTVHKPEIQKRSVEASKSGQMVEEEIVPKKSYLCYSTDDNVAVESDPFNSEEGWGLGECEEAVDVTPGFSHLNEQITQLKKEKDVLKAELETNNIKLLKALKKVKELKTSNDVLNNELKIAKQISQSSFLDSAIEDELRINVQELEKKVTELTADISKEKREKDSLRKQNEVFHNANDRLTEMKEKLENEIELWKYKFKEANDKASTFQWDSETRESPSHSQSSIVDSTQNQYKDEIIKIEKENDELHSMIEQLTLQNKELLSQQTKLESEISKLNEYQRSACKDCETLKMQLLQIQKDNEELQKTNDHITNKLNEIEIRYSELVEDYKSLETESTNTKNILVNEKTETIEKCAILQAEVHSLRISDEEAKNQIVSLTSQLENTMTQLRLNEENKHVSEQENVKILELSQKYKETEDQCNQLKDDLKEATNKILQLESTNKDLLENTEGHDQQINVLNLKLQNLNTENDNLLSTVAELRSSVSSAVDQRGFEIAELWKQHLSQRENDFQKIELDLRTQLAASEAKYEQLLDNVQSSSQEETNKLVIMEQISSLQNKLQDKEEHLRDLQEKYAEVINQMDVLRSEMQDEKITHDNKLLEQQEEYEKLIQEVTITSKQNTEGYEQTFKSIQTELAATKAHCDELRNQVEDLQSKLQASEAKSLELTNQLLIKDNEIYQKSQEFSITLSQRNEEFENVRQQLLKYEKKIEDLNYEKESELAVLRLKMHDNENRYQQTHDELDSEKSMLIEQLNAKITECTALNKQIVELNQALEEQGTKINEMQTALENQELDIVTYKDEIITLQDMLRSSTSKIQKHVSFASDTKPSPDEDVTETGLNKELLDAVPRAELDLALYMLHQRDVRCEELTMELTQLLEERDTLQLRLSDSLRSNEELKTRYKGTGLDETLESTQETISELPSFNIEKEQHFVDVHRGQTSRSSSISDPDGDKPKLQAKLSELRTVKHSRDVRLRHESEQRQMDLRLLQRDVANLPPEAVEQLTQAHHTLSRDSQSTSTVLLNWLRGKSTPKVVHM